MSFLMDPNVAYLLLVIGFFLAIIALFSPGTGVLEVGAIFMIILAGYSIYNLPFNAWALVILLAGVFPFLLALRKSRHWLYLIVALVAFVISMAVFGRVLDRRGPRFTATLAAVVMGTGLVLSGLFSGSVSSGRIWICSSAARSCNLQPWSSCRSCY